MKITQKDINETQELGAILAKIDQIDSEYVNSITDEIFKKQPFFLSVLLGYHHDISTEELEEIMKIYFLIWEHFKSKINVQKKEITKSFFEEIDLRNIQMFKYVEGEKNQQNQAKIYSDNIQNIKSKALLTAVLYRYTNRPVLIKMNPEIKGIILIGIKSFIECFEKL